MKKKHIRVTEPSITQKEIQYVAKAVGDGWGKNAYTYIKLFEKKFAEYIGVKYAIATSSCTGALHIALRSLEIGRNDEVIIPDITWAATAFAVTYTGAKPVFSDILATTWCIDPDSIENRITKRTKAIIPVHLYGHPANMDAIGRLAKKHKLYVIEDAAQSIGASFKGRKTGSFGDFSCFSFHGTKTLTTGEGGILLTNNKNFYEKALYLSNMAKEPERIFCVSDIGLKYKMTDMQAALGLAQLSRIKDLLKKKRTIFSLYQKILSEDKRIQMNAEDASCVNSFWMPTIIWDRALKKRKEDVMKEFKKYNIDTRPFFYPLSSMKPFRATVDNPVSYDISRRAINLPCAYSLTKEDIRYVCSSLFKILYS